MPKPLTEEDARKQLARVQVDIDKLEDAQHASEDDDARRFNQLARLRRAERDLIIFLTPERSGVPRVIRKA